MSHRADTEKRRGEVDVSKLNQFAYKHNLQNNCEIITRQKNQLKQWTLLNIVCYPKLRAARNDIFELSPQYYHVQVEKNNQLKERLYVLTSAALMLKLEQYRDQHGPCTG